MMTHQNQTEGASPRTVTQPIEPASAVPVTNQDRPNQKKRKKKRGARGKNKRSCVKTNKHAERGNELRIMMPPKYLGSCADDVLEVRKDLAQKILSDFEKVVNAAWKDHQGKYKKLVTNKKLAHAKAIYAAKVKEHEEWKANQEALMKKQVKEHEEWKANQEALMKKLAEDA